MFSSRTKTLLKNVIRHTDTHNRIIEEDDMWQLHKRKKTNYRRRSRSPRDYPRAHMDRQDHNPSLPDERDDKSSTFWQRELFKTEESDPARWGHGGYKELYPEDFESDRSKSGSPERSTKPSSGKKKHKHKSPKKVEKKKKKKEKKKKHKKDKSKSSRRRDERSDTGEEPVHKSEAGRAAEHGPDKSDRKEHRIDDQIDTSRKEYDRYSDRASSQKNGVNVDIVRNDTRTEESRKPRRLTSRDANMFSRALLAVSTDAKNNPVRKRPSPIRRSPSERYNSRHRRDRMDRNSRSHQDKRRAYRSRSKSPDRSRSRRSRSWSPRRRRSSSRNRDKRQQSPKDISRDKNQRTVSGKYFRKRRFSGSSSDSDSSDSPSPKRTKDYSSSDSNSSDD